MVAIAIIAKECLPGKVKTRLSPAFTHEEGAELASAALSDTMAAVSGASGVSRRILFFAGSASASQLTDFELLPQLEGSLDERLGYLFDVVDEPLLMVGMDTPQLAASVLSNLAEEWDRSDYDTCLGLAVDGGFWALGMKHPNGDLIRGVKMSQSTTGAEQLGRLHGSERSVLMLPEFNDVDTFADAQEVADLAPESQFGETFKRILSSKR